MSLKAFHVFFITLAIIVTFYFGTWLFVTVEAGEAAVRFVFGALTYAVGIVLVMYGRYFVRKFRDISYI
jgi:hypothetical protein